MRRLLRPLRRHAGTLTTALALVVALFTWAAPSPVAHAAVTPGGAFGSAVPCLTQADQVAITRFDDTLSNYGTYYGGPPTPAAYPALQTRDAAGTFITQAMLSTIGSVYSMAYDDGAASGRERLFVAAYTRRLVAYGPEGPGGIYMFTRSGTGWVADGAFRVAGVPNVAHTGGSTAPVDEGVVGNVGRTALGGMVVSPDGTALYVVDVFTKRIVRFALSVGAPVLSGAWAIDFSKISLDPAVQADLIPFALAWDSAPVNGTQPLLLIGVTDTAYRGITIVGGREEGPKTTNGTDFTVPPRAYVLMLNPVVNAWYGVVAGTNLDLGNDPAFTTRLGASGFAHWNWPHTLPPYAVRGWNPWRHQLASIAGENTDKHYPQPLLTSIEIVRDTAPTATITEPKGLLVLGFRDRTGDLAFNAGRAAPQDDIAAIAQGDTVALRWNGSAYTLATTGADYYQDDALAMAPGSTDHIENTLGALARIPGAGTGVGGARDTLYSPSLGGMVNQGLTTWANAGAGGAGSYTNVIDAANHAATKATNMGDVEVLCSYALVGGRLWDDANDDGIQNGTPPEAGIGGVTLEVVAGDPATATTALASATTDAQGRYLFAIPPNSTLNIRLSAAGKTTLVSTGYRTFAKTNVPGSTEATDSDAAQDATGGYLAFARAGVGPRTVPIAAPWRASDARSFDIGLRKTAPTGSIGDRVWNDANGDGIQDAGEPGVPGVTVRLEELPTAVTFGTPISQSTTTNAAGKYTFATLPPGRYRVIFTVPAGWLPTRKDQGGNDTLDSDADAASGYATVSFDLADAQAQTQWDFGLKGSTDVALTKTGPATAAAGALVSYALTAQNLSAFPATTVVVVDTLPAGLSYVSANPAPSSVAGQVLTWNLGDLAGNTSQNITVNARAAVAFTPATATTQVATNCARVSTATPDIDAANDSACAQTTTLQRPELTITKTGPASALVGDEFAYTLTVANTGSGAASTVVLDDPLPAGLRFVRFTANPGCTRTAARVTCTFVSLTAGASASVSFVVNADVATVATSVINSASVRTVTPGDDPSNNAASATTAILFPNPGLSLVGITPNPLPVGEPGSLTASYRNTGTGLARSSVLTVTYDVGATLGALPSGCVSNAAARQVVCPLGDLAAGATGAVVLPIRLPATPVDASSFAADSFTATAQIGSATPERAADMADNTAPPVTVNVIRPNVYVSATGPASSTRLTWGSGLVYTVGYGNSVTHGSPPRPADRTRAAETTVLTVNLPADASLLNASVPPTSVSGQVLVWHLGTLAPQAVGSLRIAVRTNVPAGTVLHLDTVISTGTPGDDLGDNTATVDTTIVEPPVLVPAPTGGALRLAIHSEFDPLHGGSVLTDAVYLSPAGNTRIAWPTGEVLDFTPRLDTYTLADPGWPLAYRARITGWSLEGTTVAARAGWASTDTTTLNGRTVTATAPDSRGVAGCRGGAHGPTGGSALTGCIYPYVGAYPDGRSIDAFLPTVTALREADMATQGHLYWTQPPAPPMRPDVYLYTLDPIQAPRVTVAVEVEVWAINLCPDFLLTPLGACGTPIELPQPPRARQPIRQPFDVTLVVPRSVVGPGGITSTP